MELLTDYHHISIIRLIVLRWCVWKVGERFPDQV